MDLGVFRYAFGLCVWALSLAGYCLVMVRKASVPQAFAPAVALTTLPLFVMAGGMAGLLLPASILLHLVGLVLLVWALRDCSTSDIKDLLGAPSSLFFFVASLGVAVVFANDMLGHWDDFTHWGEIVRDMCEANAYPGDGSRVAAVGESMSYPPGTATLVYFANVLLGYTEGHAIVAQDILVVALVTTVMHFADEQPRSLVRTVGFVLFGAACLLFTVYADGRLLSLQSLLVDEVLAVVFGAAIIVFVAARPCVLRASLYMAPLVLFGSLVKDNGKAYLAFLCLCAGVYALYRLRQALKESDLAGKRVSVWAIVVLVATVGAALVLLAAWSSHVNAAFATGYEGAKYSISLGMFGQQNLAAASVVAEMATKAFVSKKLFVAVFWGLNAAAIALAALAKKQGRRAGGIVLALVLCDLFIAVTLVILALLYVYLMPPEELVWGLGSFERYYASALLTLYMALGAFVLRELWASLQLEGRSGGDAKAGFAKAGFLVAVVVVCALILPNVRMFARPYDDSIGLEYFEGPFLETPVYNHMREGISKAVIPLAGELDPQTKVAIYYGEAGAPGYKHYLTMYETKWTVLKLDHESTADDFREALADADAFVLIGDDGSAQEALAAQGLEPVSESVIYGVEHTPQGASLAPLE